MQNITQYPVGRGAELLQYLVDSHDRGNVTNGKICIRASRIPQRHEASLLPYPPVGSVYRGPGPKTNARWATFHHSLNSTVPSAPRPYIQACSKLYFDILSNILIESKFPTKTWVEMSYCSGNFYSNDSQSPKPDDMQGGVVALPAPHASWPGRGPRI